MSVATPEPEPRKSLLESALFLIADVKAGEGMVVLLLALNLFLMRAGDVLAAGAVFVGQALGFAVPVFAGINVALAAVWVLIVSRLASENQRRMKAAHAE